eukprot:3940450-Rhodomonas_salina.2
MPSSTGVTGTCYAVPHGSRHSNCFSGYYPNMDLIPLAGLGVALPCDDTLGSLPTIIASFNSTNLPQLHSFPLFILSMIMSARPHMRECSSSA